MGLRFILALVVTSCAVGCSRFVDHDRDGISDQFEAVLLQRFAPVILLDEPYDGPRELVGCPVSITVFRAATTRVSDGKRPRLKFTEDRAKWQPGWPRAIERNDGIYGRVWRPFPDHPSVVSVQYFFLLTYNRHVTAGRQLNANAGDHDGDWLCLDFDVDTSSDPPRIARAIYHNHGRQLFLKPEAIELRDGRPVAYLERGSNEPWPNAGPGDESGWPSRGGFATNRRFVETIAGRTVMDENDVCGPHRGLGNVWDTARGAGAIPNIGDNGVSSCGDEGAFLLTYDGFWGDEATDAKLLGVVVNQVDPPTGPPFNSKMWWREFPPAGW